MAIKFLDDITLESNQIQDVAVENISSDPTGAGAFDGRIIYNTTTTTLKYYNGTAWVSLDGTGNVDSVTGSGGLLNAGTAVDVDIRPDYTTAANIIQSASGAGTLAATSTLIANVTNAVGEYTLTQIGAVVNGLLSGFTVAAISPATGTAFDITDGDTLSFTVGAGLSLAINSGVILITNTGVTSFTAASSTFVTATPSGVQSGASSLTLSLSATGTPGSNTYLRGDNTWATIAAGFQDFNVSGNGTGSVTQTISNGDTLAINGDGVYIDTFGINTDIVRISHILTAVTAAAYAYPSSVTVDAAGHITAITQGSAPQDTTYTIPVTSGSNAAVVTLTPSSGTPSTLTINGTTNEIAITESTGNNGSVTIGLPSDVTIANDLTVTADMSAVQATLTGNLTGTTATFTGQVTIPQTPTAAASAASKNYVDTTFAGSGALIFQGGYNAATNTPDLDVSPSASIKQGWTYAVTAAGNFFTEAVEDGDLLIAESDAPTALSDWTVVQNNIGLATNTVTGISKFAVANGFASGMTDGEPAIPAQTAFTTEGSASSVPVITTNAFGAVTAITDTAIAIATSQVTGFDAAVDVLIEATQFKANIGNGSSTSYVVNHALNTRDVIVQIYDNTTYETVQCKVIRTDANNVTISTAAAAINAGLRVVIQSLQ
tara:strand:+ start:1780 stop:3762 length:1983 start_codon:yes stop_codon:yes gene_type:complete